MNKKIVLGMFAVISLILIASVMSFGDEAGVTVNVINTTNVTISNIMTSAVTSNSINISWTTNKFSNSTVQYGTSFSLGSTSGDSVLKMNHTIKLTGLSTLTTYYYNVTSCDGYGNCQTNGTFVFNTSAAPVSPSGGGGGGGGGGSGAGVGIVPKCIPVFLCDEYTECADNTQTRACEDIAGCLSPKTESRDCVVTEKEIPAWLEQPRAVIAKVQTLTKDSFNYVEALSIITREVSLVASALIVLSFAYLVFIRRLMRFVGMRKDIMRILKRTEYVLNNSHRIHPKGTPSVFYEGKLNKELLNYVKKAKKNGFTIKQIAHRLKKEGMHLEEIMRYI